MSSLPPTPKTFLRKVKKRTLTRRLIIGRCVKNLVECVQKTKPPKNTCLLHDKEVVHSTFFSEVSFVWRSLLKNKHRPLPKTELEKRRKKKNCYNTPD